MNPIASILSKFSMMVLDGGQATEYEGLGFDLNHHLWSAKLLIENPEAIAEVSRRYLEAGADCVVTPTYQASFPGFRKLGYSDQEITGVFQESVQLSCEVREQFWEEHKSSDRPKPLVAGSIGSYGAYLADGSEYSGDYSITDEELSEFHQSRLNAMLNTGDENTKIDILAFETIPSFSEAVLLGRLLRNFPEMYAWISFSIRNENQICDGYSLKLAAEYFSEHKQIAAIGVNCTHPDNITSVIEYIKKVTAKPIIVYPNSGEHYSAHNKSWSGKTGELEDFGMLAKRWYASGAKIIGGCCRTTPDNIGKIAAFRKSIL